MSTAGGLDPPVYHDTYPKPKIESLELKVLDLLCTQGGSHSSVVLACDLYGTTEEVEESRTLEWTEGGSQLWAQPSSSIRNQSSHCGPETPQTSEGTHSAQKAWGRSSTRTSSTTVSTVPPIISTGIETNSRRCTGQTTCRAKQTGGNMAKQAKEPAPPPVDGVPAPASAVARELGIALAVIYGMVKRGDVKNHLATGWPVGKGLEVDISEVRAARGTKKTRAPKVGSKPRVAKVKDPDTGETVAAPLRRLAPGTIVSYERGRKATTDAHAAVAKPRYSVSSVLAASGNLTFMDEGDHRHHYNGTQIDNTVYGTDRLSMMLAKGVARIERPVPVLGMVILALIVEEKIELAESLEAWMLANDLEVHIPEIIDLEEDDYVPVAGQMIEAEDEEA